MSYTIPGCAGVQAPTYEGAAQFAFDCLQLIGGGLHWDTSGDQYVRSGVRLFDDEQAAKYDAGVERLCGDVEDPFEIVDFFFGGGPIGDASGVTVQDVERMFAKQE